MPIGDELETVESLEARIRAARRINRTLLEFNDEEAEAILRLVRTGRAKTEKV
jgi:hypothetical protein